MHKKDWIPAFAGMTKKGEEKQVNPGGSGDAVIAEIAGAELRSFRGLHKKS